nr:NADH dehydrogenase subunit 2 [Iniistius pavo]
MSPLVVTIFLLTLGLGTTITFMSSNWLLAWMGLEINTLAMIPLMAHQYHPRAVEATAKYFVTQAAAAAVIMFASATNAWLTGQWNIFQMTEPFPLALLTVGIGFKLGLAPMHTWLPEVLQGLDLVTGLILSTWQKLAPFALLLQVQPPDPSMLILLGLASTVLGGWGGMAQTQLRKILAYSSVAHLGWMILVLQFSPTLTLLTLLVYFVMTFSAFITFKLKNALTINALSTSWAKSPLVTIFTPLVLLALGGLPPLLGFMPKWLILQELTKHNLGLTALAAALSALLSLYFYLRLSYALTLTMSPNVLSATTPWRTPPSGKAFPLSLSTVLTMLLLPLTPAVLALFTS